MQNERYIKSVGTPCATCLKTDATLYDTERHRHTCPSCLSREQKINENTEKWRKGIPYQD